MLVLSQGRSCRHCVNVYIHCCVDLGNVGYLIVICVSMYLNCYLSNESYFKDNDFHTFAMING